MSPDLLQAEHDVATTPEAQGLGHLTPADAGPSLGKLKLIEA